MKTLTHAKLYLVQFDCYAGLFNVTSIEEIDILVLVKQMNENNFKNYWGAPLHSSAEYNLNLPENFYPYYFILPLLMILRLIGSMC